MTRRASTRSWPPPRDPCCPGWLADAARQGPLAAAVPEPVRSRLNAASRLCAARPTPARPEAYGEMIKVAGGDGSPASVVGGAAQWMVIAASRHPRLRASGYAAAVTASGLRLSPPRPSRGIDASLGLQSPASSPAMTDDRQLTVPPFHRSRPADARIGRAEPSQQALHECPGGRVEVGVVGEPADRLRPSAARARARATGATAAEQGAVAAKTRRAPLHHVDVGVDPRQAAHRRRRRRHRSRPPAEASSAEPRPRWGSAGSTAAHRPAGRAGRPTAAPRRRDPAATSAAGVAGANSAEKPPPLLRSRWSQPCWMIWTSVPPVRLARAPPGPRRE